MSDSANSATRLPTVSIVTPTYRRHHYMEQLLRCVRLQDYPQSLIETIILDDSPEPLALREEWTAGLNVRLIRSTTKVPLGEKRNRLNRFADGKIIVPFDDDDYYPATRVSHAVEALARSGLPLAGSSLLLMWFAASDKLVAFGPYHDRHSCNGALAYTRGYARRHAYDSRVTAGEEPSFTKNFTEPMVQLDSARTMLAIAHHVNTVMKTEAGPGRCVLPDPARFPGLPQQSWLDLVPDEESRAFYRRMFAIGSAKVV